jgi:hypothetical protein
LRLMRYIHIAQLITFFLNLVFGFLLWLAMRKIRRSQRMFEAIHKELEEMALKEHPWILWAWAFQCKLRENQEKEKRLDYSSWPKP